MELEMNKLQHLLYNEGERLVPYVSHNEDELVRHRSSYAFFYRVIEADRKLSPLSDNRKISIVDLGFGCGYGCAILSGIPNSSILGIDIGEECKIFSEQYYCRQNVDYKIDDLAHFIPSMSSYDYAVSRGVLEHVPEGLSLIEKIKFNRRVMIDVPYNEKPGNEHHVLTGIGEDAFAHLENCELFYEDIDGAIYTSEQRPEKANMIMIVLSDPALPKVSSLLEFPLLPVRDDTLERINNINATRAKQYYQTPNELLVAVEKLIKETDVVLDIGCGIRPMNYFRPKLHILVDPCQEYIDILSYRSVGDKSVLIFHQDALQFLGSMAKNSVDSIFLLDVIEHIDKDVGQLVIRECERVAREQIVIFTPLGFMEQHTEKDGVDAWGLSGGSFQKHLSGWAIEEFDSTWEQHICNEFHAVESTGRTLDYPHGAFFAIKNIKNKSIKTPDLLHKLRIPLFTAYDAEKYFRENSSLKQRINELLPSNQQLLENTEHLHASNQNLRHHSECLQVSYKELYASYQNLLNSRSMRFIQAIKKCLKYFKIEKLLFQ
jgi:hypothetical protein